MKKWKEYLLIGAIVATVPFAIPAILVAAWYTGRKEDEQDIEETLDLDEKAAEVTVSE